MNESPQNNFILLELFRKYIPLTINKLENQPDIRRETSLLVSLDPPVGKGLCDHLVETALIDTYVPTAFTENPAIPFTGMIDLHDPVLVTAKHLTLSILFVSPEL